MLKRKRKPKINPIGELMDSKRKRQFQISTIFHVQQASVNANAQICWNKQIPREREKNIFEKLSLSFLETAMCCYCCCLKVKTLSSQFNYIVKCLCKVMQNNNLKIKCKQMRNLNRYMTNDNVRWWNAPEVEIEYWLTIAIVNIFKILIWFDNVIFFYIIFYNMAWRLVTIVCQRFFV